MEANNIFRTLHYRNFRLFFMGQNISLIGTWMQQVAMGWLVYRMTSSPLLLGVVGFSSQIPTFKDADPKGPNYFVLRDTFAGNLTKPTDLSLWFLANSMTREGNVFHFDGQCPVDMDVFVNTPAKAEPQTGTYGHINQAYRRLVASDPNFYPHGLMDKKLAADPNTRPTASCRKSSSSSASSSPPARATPSCCTRG